MCSVLILERAYVKYQYQQLFIFFFLGNWIGLAAFPLMKSCSREDSTFDPSAKMLSSSKTDKECMVNFEGTKAGPGTSYSGLNTLISEIKDSGYQNEEGSFDTGLDAWLQVLGSFFLFFNSWYVQIVVTAFFSASVFYQ
jgi:hypothetical protein